jgi:hypothetical protein
MNATLSSCSEKPALLQSPPPFPNAASLPLPKPPSLPLANAASLPLHKRHSLPVAVPVANVAVDFDPKHTKVTKALNPILTRSLSFALTLTCYFPVPLPYPLGTLHWRSLLGGG